MGLGKTNRQSGISVYDNVDRNGVCVPMSTEAQTCSDLDSYDYSDCKLFKDMTPILVCMRIFGMYFKRVQFRTKTATERHVIWCYTFCTLLILNFIRSLSVYTTKDKVWSHAINQKLLATIWSAECAVKVIVLLYFCYNQKEGLANFFRRWKLLSNDAGLDSFSKILMLKFISMSFMFIICNSFVFPLILIYVPELEHLFLEVSWRNVFEYDNPLLFKIMLGFFAMINSASSILPATFYIILMLSVGKRFKKYKKEFESTVLDNGSFDGNLEDYRIRHQKLCSLLYSLDAIFCPAIAVIFLANVVMFCFVLYTLIKTITAHHASLMFINLFWVFFIIFQMAIISITAAWVNFQAHGPLASIFRIRTSQCSGEIQTQLTLFLSRLTGTQIGFTAMKMFVIDRSFILKTIALMVTYCVFLKNLTR